MPRPRPTSRPSFRSRSTVVAGLLLVMAGCGSADGSTAPGPTVAESRFDGRFELIGAMIDDADSSAADGVVFEFDAQFGGLGVETACGTMLGAYSLLADGSAGVTITGGTDRSCSAAERALDDSLRSALDRVDAWIDAGDGFELRSADGRDQLPLLR